VKKVTAVLLVFWPAVAAEDEPVPESAALFDGLLDGGALPVSLVSPGTAEGLLVRPVSPWDTPSGLPEPVPAPAVPVVSRDCACATPNRASAAERPAASPKRIRFFIGCSPPVCCA
jgi:hypothetical protein